MQKGISTTKEDKIKILTSVIATYAEGEYTIKSILDTVPMTDATFHSWLRIEEQEFKDLKDAYKKAQRELVKANIQHGIPRVVNNLFKLADGFEYEEEKTVFGSRIVKGKDVPYVKHKEIIKKRFPPNLGANIFIAKNADPDMFKDAMEHNINTKVPNGLNLDNLTEEQRKVFEDLLKD